MIKIESGNKTLSKFGFPSWKPLYAHKYGGVRDMKIKVEKVLKLEDGKHEGKIEDIKYRNDPYEYTDVVVKVEDGNLTVGYPTKVTEKSGLGMLLERFGAKLEVGKNLEPEEFLTKGKEVVFQTITKKSEKGEFSNIIPESLKPKK